MTIRIPDEAEFRARAVLIEGAHNFRDIGGYPTADGRITRDRVLFRSDSLHNLDDDARLRLDELGVRTVVDLRSDDERRRHPDAIGDRRLVEESIFGETTPQGPRTLPEVYDLMIDRLGDRLTAAIRALAAPDALPAVVHCAAGKDRTGVVIGLVLSAIGVPDDVVAADYAATALFLTPDFIEVLGHGEPTDEAMLASEVGFMQALLSRVEREHGGAAAYLAAHGLDAAELARLRDGLTVEA